MNNADIIPSTSLCLIDFIIVLFVLFISFRREMNVVFGAGGTRTHRVISVTSEWESGSRQRGDLWPRSTRRGGREQRGNAYNANYLPSTYTHTQTHTHSSGHSHTHTLLYTQYWYRHSDTQILMHALVRHVITLWKTFTILFSVLLLCVGLS